MVTMNKNEKLGCYMLLLLFFTLLKGKLLTICPGKLIQKIVQIFSSPDHEPDRTRPYVYYWKTHPCEFHEYLFRFCKIHEQDCITGKFIHVALVLVKDYFRLNALFWMSFPVILPLSCPKILKLTVG